MNLVELNVGEFSRDKLSRVYAALMQLSDMKALTEASQSLLVLTDVGRVSFVAAPGVGQLLQSVTVWSTGKVWAEPQEFVWLS